MFWSMQTKTLASITWLLGLSPMALLDLPTILLLVFFNIQNAGLNASLITLPQMNDSDAAMSFLSLIRNSNVTQNLPMNVPTDIDRQVYITVATNTIPCDICTRDP